ncbi:14448_t:CDS:10 [Ambispora leptoticha]|uniref:14448_t:CDS:1 n=1 Tax=Ambispora leptoticha TaxID=144679 RepID=A0A9N8WFB0_9GLOM|nr:14448_t:CDS:10 [Ambispora leptoticha]
MAATPPLSGSSNVMANTANSTITTSNITTTNTATIGTTNHINPGVVNNSNANVNGVASTTNTFSWSSVAAANSNNIVSSRALHNEPSEKTDVPGGAESALSPFKYSKEFMLKFYKPVGLPLEFERHEYVTSDEPLPPMALLSYTEQEQKLLSGQSVNSDLTRRIASNVNVATATTASERTIDRGPFSPRGDKPSSTGLTSPRTERFERVGSVSSVLRRDGEKDEDNKEAQTSRPNRILRTASLSIHPPTSTDDLMWNGVNRHAVGTFDSHGVFRIPGSSNHSNTANSEALPNDEKSDIDKDALLQEEPAPLYNGKSTEHGNDSEISPSEHSQSSETIQPEPPEQEHKKKEQVINQQTENEHSSLLNNQLENAQAAFAYSGLEGTTPPLTPSVLPSKYSAINSAFADTSTGSNSLFSNIDSRKSSSESEWLYRDPAGKIQGPFSSQEMNDWFKGGFFTGSLMVKRVDDPSFEPLANLIRKTGDEDKPFSAPLLSGRPPLTIAMPPNTSGRLVNDPFQRSGWGAPSSPSTAQLFLDQQRFNPFGGTTSVPTTPFDRYQFGSVFGNRTGEISNGWNDLNTTTTNNSNSTWAASETFTSSAGNLSPRQNPSSPLFNSNSAFGLPQTHNYMEHQRALNSQIERFGTISGPISAPISNAPTALIDVISRAAAPWTATNEQQTPSSPWNPIVTPNVAPTSSRVTTTQHEEVGYFGLRKDHNFGLNTQPIQFETSTLLQSNEAQQFGISGAQTHDSELEIKVNKTAEEIAKVVLSDEEPSTNKHTKEPMVEEKKQTTADEPINTNKTDIVQGAPTPSLREIQEMEARKAAERKAVERTNTANFAQNAAVSHTTKEDIATINTSWGMMLPNSSTTTNTTTAASNSSSLSSSPIVTAAPAWHSNNIGPKKTLREIQKEEEEAMKKRHRMREMQQQASLNAAAAGSSTASSGLGKRYADTVVAGGVTVAGVKKPASQPAVGSAWTIVAAGKPGAASRVGAGTNPPLNVNSNTNIATSNVSKLGNPSKESSFAWDVDSIKNINSLQNAQRTQIQTGKTNELSKNSTRNTDQNAPRPPSEEFLKWCRNILRPLNSNINVDDFIQMLLTFPLEPPPITIEIIQESIYEYSTSLDGRRFADEFVKRRKADAAGVSMSNFSSYHGEGKPGKEVGTNNSVVGGKEDTSSSTNAFKVVTAKKGKKKH